MTGALERHPTAPTMSDASAPEPQVGSQQRRLPLVVLLTTLLAIATACGEDASSNEPTFSFVIPAGSAELIDQGEPLDILPRELVAQLDETIVIVNEDDESHLLGPWFLGPGETLRQRFTTAGVFDGACSVHPSGEFTVIVEG